MKKILLSTFITASLIIIGVTNVNAQTKAKGDATIIKKDVKAIPVTNTVTKNSTKSNVNTTAIERANKTQKKEITPQRTTTKAIPVTKDLRRKDAEIAPISKSKKSK